MQDGCTPGVQKGRKRTLEERRALDRAEDDDRPYRQPQESPARYNMETGDMRDRYVHVRAVFGGTSRCPAERF